MLIQNTSIKLNFNTVINTMYDNKNQHYCFSVLFFFLTVYNEITTFIIFFNLLGLKKKKRIIRILGHMCVHPACIIF